MIRKPKVSSDIIFFGSADVAQLVEQLIRNEKVDSSIPFIGTKRNKGSFQQCLFYSYFRWITFAPMSFNNR